MRSAPILRATALVIAAALALHELRYLIAGRPGGEQFTTEHGYLPLVGAGAALLLGLAGAMLLRGLAFARRTGTDRGRPVSLTRCWLLATGALLALHFGQEAAELTLNGAPLTALAAHGAVLVLPLAAVAGLVVALGLRGARRVLSTAAARARRPRRGPAPVRVLPALPALRPTAPPLALNLSQRAPPVVAA